MISDALQDLATRLEVVQRETRHAQTSKTWFPTATPASMLGYHCERRIVYARLWPTEASPIGPELASIFVEGRLHERDVKQELSTLGFEVVEAEVPFRDETLDIKGAIDGKIEIDDPTGRHSRRRIPTEIKSITGAPPRDADDWRNHSNNLLRRYYAQLSIYLYLTNELEGLGLFKSKITGLWSPVPIEFDFIKLEPILQRAERIRDAVALIKVAGDDEDLRRSHLPKRIPDRSECPGCPFRDSICFPAEAPIDPLLVSDDAGLLQDLDELDETRLSAKRNELLGKKIKARVKLTFGDRFVVGGRWLITKKTRTNGVRIVFEKLGASTT